MLSATERSIRGRIGGLSAAAQHNPRDYTRSARKAFLATFDQMVDPDGILPEAERTRRAPPSIARENGLYESQTTVPSPPSSTCPACGWRFTPRSCCGDPGHDFATQCPKCLSVFISPVTS